MPKICSKEKFYPSRKPINLDRVLFVFFKLEQESPGETGQIAVKDIIRKVREYADDHGEVLGKRTQQFIENAIFTLKRNGYLDHVPTDKPCVIIKAKLRKLIEDLGPKIDTVCQNSDQNSEPIHQHRMVCHLFHSATRKMKNITKKHLHQENEELRDQISEHAQHCPILLAQESGSPVVKVDEASAMSSSFALPDISVPLQKSLSLHNRDAYPTPETGARVSRESSLPSPHTPSQSSASRRSFIIPGSFGNIEDDYDMDVDMDFPSLSQNCQKSLFSLESGSHSRAITPDRQVPNEEIKQLEMAVKRQEEINVQNGKKIEDLQIECSKWKQVAFRVTGKACLYLKEIQEFPRKIEQRVEENTRKLRAAYWANADVLFGPSNP